MNERELIDDAIAYFEAGSEAGSLHLSYAAAIRLCIARLEAVTGENGRLRVALAAGVEVASQYMDTERGDLDGWIEANRASRPPLRRGQR